MIAQSMKSVGEQEFQQTDTIPLHKVKRHSSNTKQVELSTVLSNKRQRTADSLTYVEVLHESLSIVLSQESHLFSQIELDILSTFRLLTGKLELIVMHSA
jgi:hypothetical protein